MDVFKKIEEQEKDSGDKPLKDIIIEECGEIKEE